jgi:hypothetical protein
MTEETCGLVELLALLLKLVDRFTSNI